MENYQSIQEGLSIQDDSPNQNRLFNLPSDYSLDYILPSDENGQTSVACIAIDNRNKQKVFIKKFNTNYQDSDKGKQIDTEINAGLELSKPQQDKKFQQYQKYLIKYFNKFSDQNDSFYIVEEYFEGIILEKYIQQQMDKLIKVSGDMHGKIYKQHEQNCLKILYRCIQGLIFINKQGYCHRDLNSKNIMVDPNNIEILKIIDYGSIKYYGQKDQINESYKIDLDPEESSLIIGTAPIIGAPEIFLNLKILYDVLDVWSIGCIFYFMLTGKFLFQDEMEKEQKLFKQRQISQFMRESQSQFNEFSKEKKFSYPNILEPLISDYSKNILSQCLIFDHQQRPKFEQLLLLYPFNKYERGYSHYSTEDIVFHELLQSDLISYNLVILSKDYNENEKEKEIKQKSKNKFTDFMNVLIDFSKFLQDNYQLVNQVDNYKQIVDINHKHLLRLQFYVLKLSLSIKYSIPNLSQEQNIYYQLYFCNNTSQQIHQEDIYEQINRKVDQNSLTQKIETIFDPVKLEGIYVYDIQYINFMSMINSHYHDDFMQDIQKYLQFLCQASAFSQIIILYIHKCLQNKDDSINSMQQNFLQTLPQCQNMCILIHDFEQLILQLENQNYNQSQFELQLEEFSKLLKNQQNGDKNDDLFYQKACNIIDKFQKQQQILQI